MAEQRRGFADKNRNTKEPMTHRLTEKEYGELMKTARILREQWRAGQMTVEPERIEEALRFRHIF